MSRIEELLVTRGMYDTIDISIDDLDEMEKYLSQSEYTGNSIDCFCPKCGANRIFEFVDCKPRINNGVVTVNIADSFGKPSKKPSKEKRYKSLLNSRYVLTYCCTYNREHNAFFDLLVTDSGVMKIGQYPSVADFLRPKTKKYSSILSEQYLKELNTAIYLAAHGVGIGSFVYLRRIIEMLVHETYKGANKNGEVSEDDFFYIKYADSDGIEKARYRKFDEKIELLKDYLPSTLVEKKQIYGIVSKGVHELTEEICMEYYHVISSGVFLILDQKLKIEEEAKLKREIDKGINKIMQFENAQKGNL